METEITAFEKDKKEKLDRLRLLRAANFLGMIRWKEDQYVGARQYIRLVHPLSWLWILGVCIFVLFAYGLIELYRELPTVLREETVFW